jgi:hypothetical protein
MQNAAGKARDKSEAMDEDARATLNAADANLKYTQSLQQKLFEHPHCLVLCVLHPHRY